jgi:hypothetical protein
MSSIGESFSWPFQDAGWFGKIVIQGLITIIPIIGWIALAGWLLITIDNYRAGRRELAPVGFHLERGAGLFVVYLVYAIVFSLPGGIISGIGSSARVPALSSFGSLISFALSLFLAFLAPAIIIQTYRAGIAGGFDVSVIWQMASTRANPTLVAGVVIWVAGILGGLGVLLCCVGLLFSIPYGVAVTAGAVAWYERALSGPATTTP